MPTRTAPRHRRSLALLAALPVLACAHSPQRLHDPGALLAALEAGGEVRAVVRYGRCALAEAGRERPGPDVTGGLTVTAFEHFARGTIGNERAYTATSASQLIVHPRHGPVVNYARLRVYQDGEVEVGVKYLAPPDLRPVMEETFRCRLGDGVDLLGR